LIYNYEDVALDVWRNDNIRYKVGAAPIVELMVETRLRRFGHGERRLIDYVVRRID
jgi:hypothetical protein